MNWLDRIRSRVARDAVLSQFVSGASWLTVAGVSARGLNFIAYIVVARILGIEAFGELGMLQSSLAMFGVAANFGLGATTTRYVARYYEGDPVRAGRVIAMSRRAILVTALLLSGAVYGLAPWFARTQLDRQPLDTAVQILAVSLLFASINVAQMGVLSGFHAFDRVARVYVYRAAIGFFALVVGVALGGLHGALWGIAFSEALACVLTEVYVRASARENSVPLSPPNVGSELPILWHFSMPALLSSLMVSPVIWLCNSFLVKLENGYDQMGIFTAANQWRVLVLFLPNIFGNLILPMISKLRGSGDSAGARRVFRLTVALNLSMTSIIGIAICIGAPYTLGVFGREFVGGYWSLAFLMFSAVMISITVVIDQTIAGADRMWTAFGFRLFLAAILVTCALVLVPRWGATGLAAAYAVAHIPFTILLVLYYRLRLAP